MKLKAKIAKVVVSLLFVALLFAGVLTIAVSNFGLKLSNNIFDQVVEKTKTGYQFKDTIAAEVGKRYTPRSYETVLNEMHRMANSLVVADEIWGVIKITEKRVNGLIVEVVASDFDPLEKYDLLQILGRWKNKNFLYGVHDHNYLWEKLGGNVGRAQYLRPYVWEISVKQ